MRYPCLALLVAAMMLATLDFTAAAAPIPWIERVLQAAPYLPGRWHVEGAWGEERWQGELSCRLVPGQWTYWITCTSEPQDGNEPQSVTLLSGSDRRNGRSIDARVPPSGFWADPKAGQNKLVGKPRVTREGPDHFVWESATSTGTPLTLVFRRIHETAKPIIPAETAPEEVPARPLQ